MIKIITSVAILLVLLTCARNNRVEHRFEIGEAKEANLTHPILTMEVIEIPSTGKIIRIDGEAEIKKAELNTYERVVLGTKVNENDILWLKKDTVVVVQFKDGSYLANKPVREEKFFTFERISR